MNNKAATQLLRAYRSNGSDADDPVFQQALTQTRQDPKVGQWFQEEQAVDEVIRLKLSAVPVPGSLREDILAMAAVQTKAPSGFWGRYKGRFLALAAALLMIMGGGLLWMNQRLPPLSFESYPVVAARFIQSQFELDRVARDIAGAEQWMQEQGFSGDLPVPAALADATDRGVGCAPFDWHGEQVLLFCFWRDDGSVLHYFVMHTDSLPDALPAGEMRVARHREYQTVTWQEGQYAFVLTTSNSNLDTRTLLLDRVAGLRTLAAHRHSGSVETLGETA